MSQANSPKELLLRRLESLPDLPTLPDVVFRIEQTVGDPDSNAREVADVIEADPAVAARLLKVANSAYYRAAGQETASVQHAVARLGLAEVRRICLAIGAMRMFVRPSLSVNHRAFWLHCVTVGSTARSLAKHVKSHPVDADQAFLAGLLHEIGALLFDQFFDRIYSIVLRETARTKRPAHVVEQETMKMTHGEIGGFLLARWNLPAQLVDAVRFHHEPTQAPEEHRPLCQVVYLADHACTHYGCAGPGEEPLPPPNNRVTRELGIDLANLPGALGGLANEMERTKALVTLVAA